MFSFLVILLSSLFFFNNIGLIFSFIISVLYFFVRFNYSFFISNSLWMGNLEVLDSLAYFFIILSMLVVLFVLLIGENSNIFCLLNIILLLVLIGFFLSLNALYLFIFFESSFILMFFLIMLWGNNPERIEALNYFLVYSMVGSVPLLISIVFIQEGLSVMGMFTWFVGMLTSGSISHNDYNSDFVLVKDLEINGYFVGLDECEVVSFFYGSQIVFFFWVMVFLFKFPAFGLHLWLPKAHVESPVFGSMLLAGIMIKLGVIGIYRFFYSGKSMYWDINIVSWLFFYFCFSIFLVNFICSRQYDLKAFVAYSSIVHMSLVLISIWSGSILSIVGSLLMSFAHGVCSSALFLNLTCFYTISSSRNIVINSGFLYLSPLLSFFWFFLCSLNCAIPISLNFFSEIFLIFSGMSFSLWSLISFFFNIFFCGFYCIILYVYVSHGKSSLVLNYGVSFKNSFVIFLVLWYHFFLVYFYFFCFNNVGFIL
uniref:NADH-ubiquinone oxidoreductase chain 4 n=1 Tax=Bipalium kewense TaxID=66750 RepID=A0A649UB87_9PLAT|nr:NADH dehydrogenase subunit 4 [Bipalium kewense]QGI24385.1 NADH dehydrogenase subunit 4 [Bipalium kewense]